MERKSKILLAVLCLFSLAASAQLRKKEGDGRLFRSKLSVVKAGPYLGLEQGKYLNLNFGVERQWQQLKFVKPQTHAASLQFDYNFKQKVMGAQVGYWFKTGRLNLTYGARVSWRTDYTYHRFAFSPNVGYKFLQAHFQLGVHLMPPNRDFENVNTFYASLRWVFINDRDFKRKKSD
jgi:hypothetical protein